MTEETHKEKEVPMTAGEIIRYAGDLLHGLRPQPAPVLIAETLYELKAKLEAPPEGEPPPKDFAEAISRIEAKVAKMQPPLKHKPDFKNVLESAKPPEVKHEKKAS
jgi:hypothetical protein